MRTARALIALVALGITAGRADERVLVDKNVEATMRDGVTLRADIYRPSAPGKYPVPLQRTAYSKNDDAYREGFAALAQHGFAVIVQDTRGRYMSDGVARPHDEAEDALLTGTLRNFTGLRARAANETARRFQRFVVGPWTHARPTLKSTRVHDVDFGPTAGFPAQSQYERWFDAWLRNGDRSVLQGAPVRLLVMGDNKWRDEQEWPFARARATPFYPRGSGILSTTAPLDERPDTFIYDRSDPVPTGAIGGYSRMPSDQREIEKRPDVLVYSSAPLESDLEVTGPLSVTLWIASSATDTAFTAKLVDVHPDGTARANNDGILRARYRRSKSKPELLTPGEPTEITIDVGATSNVFRRGHRIRLDISSSNFPWFDRNANTGTPFGTSAELRRATQTVFHQANRPSRLILPVIPQ